MTQTAAHNSILVEIKNINDNHLSPPEGDHGIVDRPPDDEGGGGVQGDLRHVRDARGEPHVRERHLE